MTTGQAQKKGFRFPIFQGLFDAFHGFGFSGPPLPNLPLREKGNERHRPLESFTE